MRRRRAGPSSTSASAAGGLAATYAALAVGAAIAAAGSRAGGRLRAASSTRGRHLRTRRLLVRWPRWCSWRARRSGGSRSRAAAPGCGSTVLDVGQGDAILLQPAARPRSWSTAGRRATTSPRSSRGRGRAARRRDRHPRPVRPRRRDRGAARPLPGRPARLRAARAGDRSRRRGPRGATPVRVAAGRVLRSGGLRLEVLWPPPELLGRRRPMPTQTSWRWSCSPAGATSRCCSAPTRRRRRCRSTPARSTCSRSPTTAATTPAWRPAGRAAAAAGGDLGRRRTTPTATRPRRPWRRSPRTASARCGPTATATIAIDVGRRSIEVHGMTD